MAHIPVEKKTSPLAWLIPLLLLAVIAVVGALIFFDDEDEVEAPVMTTAVVADPVEPVAPVAEPTPAEEADPLEGQPVTGTITAVSDLLTGSSASLAGRKVELTGLKVMQVVGDKGFYVNSVEGAVDKKIFVMLDEVPTPDSPIEGRYDVNAGDIIGLKGEARLVTPTEILKTDDMLTRKELESLSDDMIYLHADSLSDVNRTADSAQ